jgi:hypothetical protein
MVQTIEAYKAGRDECCRLTKWPQRITEEEIAVAGGFGEVRVAWKVSLYRRLLIGPRIWMKRNALCHATPRGLVCLRCQPGWSHIVEVFREMRL